MYWFSSDACFGSIAVLVAAWNNGVNGIGALVNADWGNFSAAPRVALMGIGDFPNPAGSIGAPYPVADAPVIGSAIVIAGQPSNNLNNELNSATSVPSPINLSIDTDTMLKLLVFGLASQNSGDGGVGISDPIIGMQSSAEMLLVAPPSTTVHR